MNAAAGRSAARLNRASFGSPLTSTLAWPLFYLVFAFLVRAIMLGKPAVQVDEQFYLLVGQRMAEGALPYVDIWDRKPFGLFLLYRGVYLLPFDPVLTYQVLGIAFSVATALVIARIARMIAPERGAWLAGLAYLLFQPTFNVALGQTPVFYNLPVAIAALVTTRAVLRGRDAGLLGRGCTVMLLLGLAMEIKYTALFEGIGFGLMLLMRGRVDGWRPARVVATAILWVGIALAPTAVVLAGYAMAGHTDAFVQANFLSIFGRHTNWPDALAQISKEMLAMVPYALAILLAPRRLSLTGGTQPAALGPLRIWALFALGGFLVVPPWFDHYLGPVLVPLSVLAAPALGWQGPGGRWYGRLLLGFGALGAIAAPAFQVRQRGTSAEFAHASNLIARELHGRCLYVFEGDSALYRTTDACIPTRFAYPTHLDAMKEGSALGVDPVAEVRRLMATHPGVVVMAQHGTSNLPNLQTRALMLQTLARNYVHYAEVTLGTRKFELYRLKR